jgi:hypothetical protein
MMMQIRIDRTVTVIVDDDDENWDVEFNLDAPGIFQGTQPNKLKWNIVQVAGNHF